MYGNIHFGASLMQLRELAKKRDCSFVGAGAFIAEHTYSFEDAPIAESRPNANDLEQATQFGLGGTGKNLRGRYIRCCAASFGFLASSYKIAREHCQTCGQKASNNR